MTSMVDARRMKKILINNGYEILRYTPRHMISLQTALKYFDENKDKDVVDEQSTEASEEVIDKNVLGML